MKNNLFPFCSVCGLNESHYALDYPMVGIKCQVFICWSQVITVLVTNIKEWWWIFLLLTLCFLSIENKGQNNLLLIWSILEYTSMVNTRAVFVVWCEVVGFCLNWKMRFGFWLECKNICRFETWLWILHLFRFNISAFGCQPKMNYYVGEWHGFGCFEFLGHTCGYLSAWERILCCICNLFL